MKRGKLIILGAGFAGIEAIRESSKTGLTNLFETYLIDKSSEFAYLPSLPEILSGKTGEKKLRRDIKRFAEAKGATFLREEVKSISLSEKTVVTSKRELDYDYLIIALGAEQNYHNVPGASKAIPAYRLNDYLEIRKRLEEISQRRSPSIVIVGAGLTGVEVAGEIADYFDEKSISGKIFIVERESRVLPSIKNVNASNLAKEFLEKRGIKVLLSREIIEVGEKEIRFKGNPPLPYDLAIWTAGIKPNGVISDLDVPKVKGFIKVDQYMRVCGLNDVYAVGDISHVEVNGRVAMKMAEEAMKQATTAIRNIKRELEGKTLVKHRVSFCTSKPKCLISLGVRKALLVYRGRAFIGRTPYLMKKFIEWNYMRRLS